MTAPAASASLLAVPARWEHGSDFELAMDVGTPELPWATHPHALWGSGRQALRALLAWGRGEHGWRRLQVPSYFCQDVVAAAQRELVVAAYPASPARIAPLPVRVAAGDVVLAVGTFGVPPALELSAPAMVIEDHSHDPTSPWAMGSLAEFAIASLRKTLPLPDGGVAWSPQGLSIPPPPAMTRSHALSVLKRLSAMTLKHHYLAGADIPKRSFRALAHGGERTIATERPCGISPFSRARLETLPIASWRGVRSRNLEVFQVALGEHPGLRLVSAPFAATLVFATSTARDRVRERLIAADVYPAVLWPLDHPVIDGIPDADRDLAARSLSIHGDQRYAANDMVRVADLVRQALDA